MAFDPEKEGGVEIFDPIAQGGVALEEPQQLQQPLDPNEAFSRAGEIWDISVDLQLPLSDVEKNYNEITSKKGDVPKPTEDLNSIVSRPLTETEIAEEKRTGEEFERVSFLQKHPQLIRQIQKQQEDQLIQDYFASLPESQDDFTRRLRENNFDLALKIEDGWHRKVFLSKAKRLQIEKLRSEGKVIDERRIYTGFWNELGRNTIGGSLNVASGLIGTLASVSEGAIWNPAKLDEWANSIHKLSSKPAFTASKEGGWKGFVAASVGQALPYMAASSVAVITTGNPYAAFVVGFSVEGDNAYRIALANGATEEEAQLNRFVVGVINGAIEQLQVNQLLKFAKTGSGSIRVLSKAAQDRAMQKIIKAGGNLTLDSLHQFTREAFEEILQETTNIVAEARQNPDAWLTATDRLMQAGLGGGIVGLVLGTGGAIRTQIPTVAPAEAITKPPKAAPVAEVPAEGVITPPEAAEAQVTPLEPFTQTLAEFKRANPEKGILAVADHLALVRQAVEQGREISPEVLKDHPELAKGIEQHKAIQQIRADLAKKEGQPTAKPPPAAPTKAKQAAIKKEIPEAEIKEISEVKTLDDLREGAKKEADVIVKFPTEALPKKPTDFIDVEKVGESFGGSNAIANLRNINTDVEKAIKKVATRLKKFMRVVPEFTVNPTFTVDAEGRLVFKDKFRFRFFPSHFGIGNFPEGTTVRIDLESFGIKPAGKQALKKAKPFLGKPAIKKKPITPKAEETARDILGGVDPLSQILQALKKAVRVEPLTKAQKTEELSRRVGAAARALKTNVKKGTPTEEAIFRSTGLLKGPLTEYDQLYTSIEDILEPGAKEAAYSKIYGHPGLRYFEILNTTTSFKKLLAGSGLTPGDVKNIENVFGKTFREFTDIRTVKSDLYDRIVTIWKAGLLTGLKTSGLNTLANVSHAMTETAKDIPAALVDKTAALFTGDRTLAFTTKGTAAGIIEGLDRGWKYLRTGYDERNIGAKLDYRAVHFGTGKIAKSLQVYEETIFHLLGAEDQPFYYGAKARSLFSQAIAQAKNKKLKGKERDIFVQNLVKSPTNEMLRASVHDAEVAVFQNRTTFGDIAKSVQKVKGGEIIVPFGRTPSAVAMQIINYTPAGAIKEVAQQINAGKFNQRKFSQAFGRAAIGTGALYIGGVLLKAGLMTLDHPTTERERELWKLEGRKANSVKVGDKWRSVQVLGPAGNVLLIGGYFQRELEKTGSPTKAIVTALSGGAKSFSEQTFVRGVNQAIDALSSPERSFDNWFSSMAGSAVPTIVADIARAEDETGRRANGPIQRVQARIPIIRKKLPPAIDVFGQDLPRYGGNVLETMADPTRPAKIRRDVVVDELRRLFDKNVKVTPTKLGDRKGFDILTTEENTLLWRRAGELTYKALLALLSSEEYQNIDNDFAKGRVISAITRNTKEAAKMEIVTIKLKQGVPIVKLAESGLISIEGLEVFKFFGSTENE